MTSIVKMENQRSKKLVVSRGLRGIIHGAVSRKMAPFITTAVRTSSDVLLYFKVIALFFSIFSSLLHRFIDFIRVIKLEIIRLTHSYSSSFNQ
jgi:hypothetical protein